VPNLSLYSASSPVANYNYTILWRIQRRLIAFESPHLLIYRSITAVIRPQHRIDKNLSVKEAYLKKGSSPESIEKLLESPFLESLQWLENKQELGTHKDGAALWTLDQVYQHAQEVWLVRNKEAQIYFEAQNNGMLSQAGFTPNNCADDCFSGITIKSISALNP